MPFHSKKYRLLVTTCALTALVWPSIWFPGKSSAQTSVGPAGQVVSARQLTINGANAGPGQTVFNDSRIKTASQGMAVINLGPYGRIEMGGSTELILRISENSIGGVLVSGCMLANAPVNVAVSIHSGKGDVTSNSKRPASLTFGLDKELMQVFSEAGEALVSSGNNSKVLKDGEYVSVSTKSEREIISNPHSASDCGPRRDEEKRLVCTCRGPGLAKNASKIAKPAAISSSPLAILGIFGAFTTAATTAVASAENGPGLTCRDGIGLACGQVSVIR
jgi:hypothetical protein